MRSLAAASLGIFALCSPVASAQTDHFFPSRPAHARLFTARGELTGWSHGEAVGYIAVRDRAGTTRTFYMGYPPKIDGKTVICFNAPSSSTGTPGPMPCNDWPSSVRLNSTPVTVTYWNTTFNGKTVEASDEVDTVASSAAEVPRR